MAKRASTHSIPQRRRAAPPSSPTPTRSSDLGGTVKAARERLNTTLQAVAERANVSVSYLSRLERGIVKQATPSMLKQLAEALDLSYTHLLDLAGHPTPNAVPKGRSPERVVELFAGERLRPWEAAELKRHLGLLRRLSSRDSR